MSPAGLPRLAPLKSCGARSKSTICRAKTRCRWKTCVDLSPDTMTDGLGWVMDTSTFMHLCRAGHAEIIERLPPGRSVLIPTDANDEIEPGRLSYSGIPTISAVEWAKVAVVTEQE